MIGRYRELHKYETVFKALTGLQVADLCRWFQSHP